VRHAALLKLVGTIGQRLKEASPEPAFKLFPYSFHVVDSPEVNAFALPGGPVYVNTGIIELCDSEDQLASVLAHEMSHVAARHATEMLTTENITQLALIAAISVVRFRSLPSPGRAPSWATCSGCSATAVARRRRRTAWASR